MKLEIERGVAENNPDNVRAAGEVVLEVAVSCWL